jgi:hypothetical protein
MWSMDKMKFTFDAGVPGGQNDEQHHRYYQTFGREETQNHLMLSLTLSTCGHSWLDYYTLLSLVAGDLYPESSSFLMVECLMAIRLIMHR